MRNCVESRGTYSREIQGILEYSRAVRDILPHLIRRRPHCLLAFVHLNLLLELPQMLDRLRASFTFRQAFPLDKEFMCRWLAGMPHHSIGYDFSHFLVMLHLDAQRCPVRDALTRIHVVSMIRFE